MKRLVRFIARLYPAPWRDRYGSEFGALLEDVDSDWRTLLDILIAAMRSRALALKYGWLIAGLALMGGAAALDYSFHLPDQYQSSTVVAMGPSGSNSAVQDLAVQVTGRSWLSMMIQRHGLYPEARSRLPIENVIEQMRHDIAFVPTKGGAMPSLRIRFTYANWRLAQSVTQDLASEFAVAAQRSRSLQVLSISDLPPEVVPPQRLRVTIFGWLLGLALGGLLAAWLKSGLARGLILFGLAGALFGVVCSFGFLRTFRSSAVVEVNSAQEEQSAIVARALGAYPPALRERMSVTPVSGHFLQVALSSPDRYAAQRLVNEAAGRIIDDARESGTRNASLLDPASFPESPDSEGRTLLTSGGLLFGISLAAGMRLIRRRAFRKTG